MKVGVLGGGQLARMLALAGVPLGLDFSYYEQSATQSVKNLGPLTVASFTDFDKLDAFAKNIDVLTFESENIPKETLEHLLKNHDVRPGLKSLVTAQNRFNEKTLFDELKVPTVRYHKVSNADDLAKAANELGFPFIVKTISGGYDGKGQYRVHNADELSQVPFSQNAVYLAEEWIQFDKEVSCVAVRSQSDELRFYSLCLNTHQDGILVETTSLDAPELEKQAYDYTQRIMRALDHVGVLTVEYFIRNDQLLANEIAPRVHNTGHWTIDAAECSQFENHLRAICGLPLGDTRQTSPYKMYNIIGQWPKTHAEYLATPGLHLHDYNKEPRSLRKLGHITVCNRD
jgi:5-(carboxyamino)imidazole ribonucleotide synthase